MLVELKRKAQRSQLDRLNPKGGVNMDCTLEDCPYKNTIGDHEQRIRINESKGNDIIAIKKDVEYIIKVIDPLVETVQYLKDKPAKRWDSLVGFLIGGGAMIFINSLIG